MATTVIDYFDNQSDSEIICTGVDELRTKHIKYRTFVNMSIQYTQPQIRRGKAIEGRKTAAKLKVQALEPWYIEYYLTDPSLNIINRRVKVYGEINKFKFDPPRKEQEASELLESIISLLEDGLHPFNKEAHKRLMNEAVGISINDAIAVYEADLWSSGKRKKSIQTYMSKLKYFNQFYPTLNVNAVSDSEILTFLKSMQKNKAWTPTTYNSARIILYGFFEFLARTKYVNSNPVKEVRNLKKVQSFDTHKVFSDSDFKLIMKNLEEVGDSFTDLFVKCIYYTCIRPEELKQLKLSMINLDNNTITIPGSISKNRKTDTVHIDEDLMYEFQKYNVHLFPKDHYLFSKGAMIGGTERVGTNTPYNRFMACLGRLSLKNKGYTLYSFKHTSNIIKFKAGWDPGELMKANRHSNVMQTHTYLRELGEFIDITQKKIPKI